MEQLPVIAVINTNPDLVALLRFDLQRAGFVVVIAHIAEIRSGQVDLEDFVREHDPRVVVYDVAPPYEENWRFMDHVRTSIAFKGRQFVLTTVNERRLREAVAMDESVYEILGRGEDIEVIVAAVREASRARPVR